MSLESALYSYLGGLSAVTDLVSTRIYPSQAPQGVAQPYIIHSRVSERRFPHIAGSSGMVRCRLQVDIFAPTIDSALGVFDVVRDNLDGWRNTLMGSEELNVLSINLDDVRTDIMAPQDGGDPGTFRVSSDFIILYGESLPSV